MNAQAAALALERRFVKDHPREAARRLERLEPARAVRVIESQPAPSIAPVWEALAPDARERLIERLDREVAGRLLAEMDPPLAARLLLALGEERRAPLMAHVENGAAKLIQSLMAYPEDAAGRLMDPRVSTFREAMTAAEAIDRMRGFRRNRALRELFLMDDEGRLSGRVEIQDLATAAPGERLKRLARPVSGAVLDTAPRVEVVERIEQHRMPALPVVDVAGRLVGVIHQSALLEAVQEEASLDIQTMVGVSKDERALSPVRFAVRKRLPWLQINLATAFLAAAVVGLFQGTIAKVTALAVLMPVVAGQAGNAGAQALAVTMRGLALREISARQLPRVVFKEVYAGLINGVGVGLVCMLCVYWWSHSFALVGVIGAAMVLSMTIAGFAGAGIPILLDRLGFDPAQSTIVLTTVTDVSGFFSFLGIATLFSSWL